MANTQLLLSVGIPCVLVVLAWLSNNTRLSALEKRLNWVVDSNHRDALEIMRAMTALHERMTVVEFLQAS